MSLTKFPELKKFLSNYIATSEPENEGEAIRSFATSAGPEQQTQVALQAKELMGSNTLVEDLGMEANRWFSDVAEAKEWISSIVAQLSAADGGSSTVTKDS